MVDPIAPEPLRPAASDVRFERVSFAHPDGLPLFTGLDLAVPSGTKLGLVGLVGRSGGGKTTLIRLLLRMTDVSDGRILIGGQDITRLRQSDLRSPIAYVPQDPDVPPDAARQHRVRASGRSPRPTRRSTRRRRRRT